jgi:multicomponent Na+:H+ antiporter subunit G
MEIVKYIAVAFMIVGAIFLFLGALGIYRMPDIFNRLQAGTKASTLGAMSLILGVGLWQLFDANGDLQWNWLIKSIILIVFIGIANPLSSHAIGRAAYKSGAIPFLKKKIDAYESVANKEEEEQK